jgi:hypothetical protein
MAWDVERQRLGRRWRGDAAVLCALLSACATTTLAPPRGRTQELLVRTDPSGARCSASQKGIVVSSIDATPGRVTVARIPAEVQIACAMDGRLDARVTLGSENAKGLEDEEGFTREPSAWNVGVVASGVGGVAGSMAALGAGTATLAPAAALPLMLLLAGIGEHENPNIAYRQPPVLVLVPAAFASEQARDDYFVSLKARFLATAAAERGAIDANCHPWPCVASAGACHLLYCDLLRERADAEVGARMGRIDELRRLTRVEVR